MVLDDVVELGVELRRTVADVSLDKDLNGSSQRWVENRRGDRREDDPDEGGDDVPGDAARAARGPNPAVDETCRNHSTP